MSTPEAMRPPYARSSGTVKRIVVAVDGTGLLVRASRAAGRHAQLSSSDGTPTGALMMFIGSLAKKLRVVRPDYLVVTWDGPGARRWRRALYPDYKGNRPPNDKGDSELDLARGFCDAAGIRQLSIPAFEADDLLAAVQRQVVAEMPDAQLLVITDDKDLLQLLGDCMTTVTGLSFDAMLTAADVDAQWGVPPWWLPAVRALAGDGSDNIPGLPGIGPHRAVKMIADGGWQWPLPERLLPEPGDRLRVAVWHDLVNLLTPLREPEREPGIEEGYFALRGQAEWRGEVSDPLLSFLQKYELRSLSERLLKGRLW